MSSIRNISLLDRFKGCLVGLAIGDALGGKFEGQTAEYIKSRIPDLDALINYPAKSLWYTDDTQMMIGVSEALIQDGEIVEETLCEKFVENYVPSRGYGRGARAVIEAMEEGKDYRKVGRSVFSGGSYGNGAAMRVAPIGLLFRNNIDQVLHQAQLSALPTHSHPLGIEGAQIIAAAVAFASKVEILDSDDWIKFLLQLYQSKEFQIKILVLANLFVETNRSRQNKLLQLGNGIEAENSVISAIGCFLLSDGTFEDTIGNAIFLGGDTDTIAAMSGAIAGAFLGIDAIPKHLINKLENSPKGGAYIFSLAEDLYKLHCEM